MTSTDKNLFAKPLVSLVVIVAIVIAGAWLVFLPSLEAQDKQPANNAGCEKQVPFLNSRAQILEQFKKKEDQAYLIKRQIWSNRIAYGGQWVPKDAEKARSAVYKYDELHKRYTDEIDKQLQQFIALETNPLNCSESKKTEREKYLALARGETKNKGKDVSGQYLLKKLSKEESKYADKEFKKITEKMMKNQQKAKSKNPKPEKSMTIVAEYKQ